ncbi:hypothetical protein GA0115234_104220 [Streptomyces sp. DvalAA-43]|nr:hypothetical protein GA0115234_104220 [Streptomyces sp. DvalAA-43]
MTLDGVYGTRPDLLPRSMVRLVRADKQTNRRLTWVGRSGVQLLTLDQHLRYEHESLGRYPRNSDGAIEWSAVADELVLCSMDSDSTEQSTVIQQFTPKIGNLIFFWGSLAVPSVEMGVESSLTHLPGIAEFTPEFWIYSPGDHIVVELSFSGVVTAARVPAKTDGRSPA